MLKRFADGLIASDARVTTDGAANYDADSLGSRPHRTNGVGRIAARVIEQLVIRQPLTMRY
jgi:hypothetical protein